MISDSKSDDQYIKSIKRSCVDLNHDGFDGLKQCHTHNVSFVRVSTHTSWEVHTELWSAVSRSRGTVTVTVADMVTVTVMVVDMVMVMVAFTDMVTVADTLLIFGGLYVYLVSVTVTSLDVTSHTPPE